MIPEEAVAEERKESRLSHSDREFEKAHPERIDFLGFAFESYKHGAEYLARKLERENIIFSSTKSR